MKEVMRRAMVTWYGVMIICLLAMIPLLWYEYGSGIGDVLGIPLRVGAVYIFMAALLAYSLSKLLLPTSNSVLLTDDAGIGEWLYTLLFPLATFAGATITLLVNLAHHGGSRGIIETVASSNFFYAIVFAFFVSILLPLVLVLPVGLLRWIFAGAAAR